LNVRPAPDVIKVAGDTLTAWKPKKGKEVPKMGWFILAIILWLVAVVAVAYGFLFARDRRRAVPVGGAVLAALLGLGLFALGGLKSVPVKTIGVPQAFGAITGGVFSPGLHETWTPWLSLTDIDETVQTTTFEGSHCLTVRIGGQQSACADVTIQWQIKPGSAEPLFEDYANQGDLMTTITDAVVVREFKAVVNQVLGDYNPITDVQNVSGSATATSEFTQFGPTILADMRHDIGTRITVDSVFLPKITYDQAVENALQSIQTANANYAVATENVKVNQQQAAALQKLGTPNLNQLVAQCLTDLKDGMNAPTGFECIPGSANSLALSK
jgi:hypothetical protein